MKAINLLPVADRVRGPAKVPERASYLFLGGLGALVIAVLAVVMTQNQITDRTQEIAEAKQEQESAEQRSGSLGAFGQFAEVKRTRVASVSQLAKQRFDYERLMRELALVLPKETWITTAAAASAPDPAEAGSGTAAAAPAGGSSAAPAGGSSAAGAAAAAAGPTLKLGGCAKTQSKVAETMVRLRNLHRAEDVTLEDSTKPTEKAASAAAPSSAAGSTAAEGCGDAYAFNVTIAFAPATDQPAKGDESTPVTLGGGS